MNVAQTEDEFRKQMEGGAYDILLTDYSLPQWRGMEALKLLRAWGLDVPVILVTGFAGGCYGGGLTLPLFSLPKLLFPVITEQGRLRESIVLVEVDLLPLPGRAIGNWQDLRRRCREILEHCIYADKDLVLPAMGSASTRHMFFIVASTDLERAQIMLRRIRDRLERSVELKMNSTIKVSARGIWLPNRTGTEKLEDLVQEVADRVTDMALTADGPRAEKPIGQEAAPAQAPAGASSW